MAIVVRGSGSNAGTPSTTVTVSNNAGDFLLAVVCVDLTNDPDPSFSSGSWTLLYSLKTSLTVDGESVWVYYCASGPGSSSYTITTERHVSVSITACSGHDSTDPINASSYTVHNTLESSPVTVTAPSITTDVSGCLILHAAAYDSSSDTTISVTPPSGYSNGAYSPDSVARWAQTSISSVIQTSAGATGTADATASLSASAAWIAFHVAVTATPDVNTGTGEFSPVAAAGTGAVVPPQITQNTPGAIAYSASGGTSVTPAHPASPSAGDMLLLFVGQKPSSANSGTCDTPSGWTAVTSIVGAGGYGSTLGADTGNTNLFVFSKVATGSESGNLSVTVGTNNVCWAQILRYSCPGDLWDVAATTGSDTSAGSVSVTFASDPGVQAFDYGVVALCIPTDVSTPTQFSSEAYSQTGVTWSTVGEISEPDSNVGNDIGGVLASGIALTGPSSAAPVFTATAGGTTTNVRGPAVFVRLRALSLGGTGSGALSPAAASGTGNVGSSGNSGSGTAAFAAVTGAGTGGASVSASGAAALAPFAGAGTGTAWLGASGTATFRSFAGAGTASSLTSGVGTGALRSLAATGTAAISNSGSGLGALSAFSATGSANAACQGSGAAALSRLAGTGTAATAYSGSGAATLTGVAATGTAASSCSGSGSAALVAPSGAGTGSAGTGVSGSGVASLQPAAGSGNGAVTCSSTGSASVSAASGSGTGFVAVTVSSSGAAAFAAFGGSGEALAVVPTVAVGSAGLSPLEGNGIGATTVSSSGSAAVQSVAATGTGFTPTPGVVGSGTVALSILTGNGAAHVAMLSAGRIDSQVAQYGRISSQSANYGRIEFTIAPYGRVERLP